MLLLISALIIKHFPANKPARHYFLDGATYDIAHSRGPATCLMRD